MESRWTQKTRTWITVLSLWCLLLLGKCGKNSNLFHSNCSYKQWKKQTLPPACPKLGAVSVGIKSGTCLTGSSEVRGCCISPTFPPHLVFQAQHITQPLLTTHIPSSTWILKAPSHNWAQSTLCSSVFPLSLGCPQRTEAKQTPKHIPCLTTLQLPIRCRTCNNFNSCPGKSDCHILRTPENHK